MFSSKQLIFKELFVGTLIFCVVLGFLNDYTSIVEAKSFSILFFASFVLEVLTYLVFMVKKKVIALLKNREGILYRIITFFCVWVVAFASKFLFIWAIDVVFGDDITIHGFLGILLVVASVTIIHKLADTVFMRLGQTPPSTQSQTYP